MGPNVQTASPAPLANKVPVRCEPGRNGTEPASSKVTMDGPMDEATRGDCRCPNDTMNYDAHVSAITTLCGIQRIWNDELCADENAPATGPRSPIDQLERRPTRAEGEWGQPRPDSKKLPDHGLVYRRDPRPSLQNAGVGSTGGSSEWSHLDRANSRLPRKLCSPRAFRRVLRFREP